MVQLDLRDFARGRRQEVGKRAGQDVAGLVVDDLFEQRVADALRDAAMHLPVGDHRVDDQAGVLDDQELLDATRPVSVSTSTMATWQALENVPGGS